jgi:hypothetical protein
LGESLAVYTINILIGWSVEGNQGKPGTVPFGNGEVVFEPFLASSFALWESAKPDRMAGDNRYYGPEPRQG